MLLNESHPGNWHKHAFRAMGCEMVVWLETADSTATTAFAQVEALFAANEQALSRFRSDSDPVLYLSNPGGIDTASRILVCGQTEAGDALLAALGLLLTRLTIVPALWLVGGLLLAAVAALVLLLRIPAPLGKGSA